MPAKRESQKAKPAKAPATKQQHAARPSALLDTRIIYCGDCLDQLAKLPDGCIDLIYIDPPLNSNRNYEVFWGETEWTTIGFDTNSPYTDARAPLVAGQPENRRYRARYRDDDQPVGEWSDIIEVTAAA
jgi:hypothetical protein